jgi:hypothetical protein
VTERLAGSHAQARENIRAYRAASVDDGIAQHVKFFA